MKVIVIRHGERNYEPCYERGFIGMGLEMAPLTEIGEKQAEEAAHNELIRGTEIILSSPYTRCMQTSAIISRICNIPLKVEIDLHEWVPDLTYQNKKGDGKELGREFAECKGEWPKGETRKWETVSMMEKRLVSVLSKYCNFNKIIIVTHGMFMHQIKQYSHIPYCFVDEFDYNDSFKCAGFKSM